MNELDDDTDSCNNFYFNCFTELTLYVKVTIQGVQIKQQSYWEEKGWKEWTIRYYLLFINFLNPNLNLSNLLYFWAMLVLSDHNHNNLEMCHICVCIPK